MIGQFTKDSILDIEWHPKFPNLICLVAYYNEIAISRDRGVTWELRNHGLENATLIRTVEFHSEDENIIFAATTGGGVFRSEDGGARWTPVNSGISSRKIRCLAYQPMTDMWYAGTYDHGIFRSRDMGESWEPIILEYPRHTLTAPSESLRLTPRNPDLSIRRRARGVFH